MPYSMVCLDRGSRRLAVNRPSLPRALPFRVCMFFPLPSSSQGTGAFYFEIENRREILYTTLPTKITAQNQSWTMKVWTWTSHSIIYARRKWVDNPNKIPGRLMVIPIPARKLRKAHPPPFSSTTVGVGLKLSNVQKQCFFWRKSA